MRPLLSPRTLVVSLAAWLCVALAIRLEPEAPLVARADLFGGWLIGTIGNFLTRLLTNEPGSTGATVGRAILNLQDDLGKLGGALKDFVGEMRGWLGGLVGLLKAFRQDVILPIVKWLREHITQLKAWLKRTFRPVIDALLTIQKHLRRIYERFVRPVLEVIEVLRFITGTLSRLGVKWAAELDARLARLESAIVRNFNTILGHLNRVIDVVDSVVTFDLLFQRVPFLASLRRDAPQWIAMFWNAQLEGVNPNRSGAPDEGVYPTKEPVVIGAELGKLYRSGDGEYAPIARELAHVWMTAVRRR